MKVSMIRWEGLQLTSYIYTLLFPLELSSNLKIISAKRITLQTGELWGMGYFEETKILKKSKSQKKKIVAKSCRAKRDCPK